VIKMRNQLKLTNRKAATALALAILLLCVTAASAVSASGEQTQKEEQSYGIPENALQYNRTDITPFGQMEQVMAMENYAFNYRNLTLTLNCTRNCELNVTVDPSLKPKMLSLSLEPNQNMSLAMNLTGSPLEEEMVRTRTLNFYLCLEPNATLELQAQIRIHINQIELTHELNREVNTSQLTWQYYNTTEHQWVTVPSWINQNYLICNTTHFSTWTVAEISEQNSPQIEESTTPYLTQTPAIPTSDSPSPIVNPTENPTQITDNPEQTTPSLSDFNSSPFASAQTASDQTNLPAEYLYLGAAGIIAVIVALGIFVLKKRKL
jgi:hypothetical protein